jgi:8-oxo-dGTP pyrophosphatase MutT (NUDIX family)
MSNNSVRHREIACAIVIDKFGRFLLQQRDDIVGIIHPGKVGLFGGHREGEESYLECVVREIHEEISYFVPPERFEHLASFDGTDIDVDGGTVSGEFFVARDIPVDALVITEGSLLIVKPIELVQMDGKLTPSAKFAIKPTLTDASPDGEAGLLQATAFARSFCFGLVGQFTFPSPTPG